MTVNYTLVLQATRENSEPARKPARTAALRRSCDATRLVASRHPLWHKARARTGIVPP